MSPLQVLPKEFLILGYETLNERYDELVKCYVTQVAIDEEIKFNITRKPFKSDEALVFFQKGKTVTDGVTVEEMAKYLQERNPVFWESLVEDDGNLKLLVI